MSYRSRVATVYLLGFLIDLINMFIASVAYPAIGHSLKASVAELAWIGNGYIMGLTLAIPLSAWLTLHLGARRLLLLSLSLFIFATLQCGLSHSLFSLLFWRAIQGAGGGLLIPVGQALTWQLYAKHERAWLSAAVMLVGLLAPALSPTLGGWLAQSFSWRWIFFASVAVALPTLLLALVWLKPQLSSAEKRPLDCVGLLAGCGGLFFTLLAMTRLGEAGTDWLTACYVAAGAVLLIFFTRRSLRHPAPLLKLSLLADPLMAFSSLVYQFVPGVFIGVSLLAMLYLQGSGFSAAQAGALMIPWAMASFAAISLTGKTFNRLGPRPLIVAGCLCQATGILLLAHSLPMAAFTLMGAGGSLCSSAAQSSAFLSVSDSQLSDASALWNINRQLSFCFGIALLTLLFNQFTHFFSRPLAYKLTFYSAAAITLLPILLSLGLNNSAVKRLLTHPEKP
ncbi:MFS transporter [Kalamiella sp. sgz302252]|uniref:MFS transporter n=1 Tax=Pantoea sp. sgz302252 TaxID=3341827 RepID=UPI0036D3C761